MSQISRASPKDVASIAVLIRRVASSVNTVPVYGKFGFIATSPATRAKGVVFVPMRVERSVES